MPKHGFQRLQLDGNPLDDRRGKIAVHAAPHMLDQLPVALLAQLRTVHTWTVVEPGVEGATVFYRPAGTRLTPDA